MSFHSGRLSFCRFRISGDAPASVDEAALSILQEHAFKETEIGAPDEVEAGWITGEHLLDTQFSYEKNGFGQMLLCAMRMDTHKVPSDVKQAYRKINEQAAASQNPSGFASKAQKREAAELATRQMHEDLASGRFRRSKIVPVMWDLDSRTLYCGATGNAVQEELARLMRQSFGVELEALSAGALAGEHYRAQGRSRDWEDLHPSPFTAAPPEAHAEADDVDGPGDLSVPSVPWRAQSVDLKDFLGNEFLIWLWWKFETTEGIIPARHADGRETELMIAIDKSLDMDCAWGVRGKQTLRGDGPARLNEAGEALATGKWPRKMGLLLSDGELQWELTLQGDRMLISSAALPEAPDAQNPRELTETRLDYARTLTGNLDAAFAAFLSERSQSHWPSRREQIGQWIKQRRTSHARQPQAEAVSA